MAGNKLIITSCIINVVLQLLQEKIGNFHQHYNLTTKSVFWINIIWKMANGAGDSYSILQKHTYTHIL